MKIVYSEDHRLRQAKTELTGGELVAPFEKPERMDYVLARLKATEFGEIISPRDFGVEPVKQLHDPNYVDFIAQAYDLWQQAGHQGEAIPNCWPARRMQHKVPTDIDGKLGFYALAAETSISEGTYEAALAGAHSAMTAADLLNNGELNAFSLSRPPGHHAAYDMFGGYCFFNNAGLAAQQMLNSGAKRVTIFDVDYHHGNGTQDIFYHRSDVQFLSIHAHPEQEFPHYLGYGDETGAQAGEGFNHNYPLYRGATYANWLTAFASAIKQITAYSPDALVISLGVDTYEHDPISHFKLRSEDFVDYGQRLAQLNLPTVFIMEGGYAVEEIGINTVNVLQGFTGRS